MKTPADGDYLRHGADAAGAAAPLTAGSRPAGRIAYTSRSGPAVLPVNYALQDGAVVFRTAPNGPLDEDLRTGITGADYKVAFEIDSIDLVTRQGWSVLIQGPAHHVAGAEEEAVRQAGVEPWAPGDRELFVRIVPSRVTGRRVRPA